VCVFVRAYECVIVRVCVNMYVYMYIVADCGIVR